MVLSHKVEYLGKDRPSIDGQHGLILPNKTSTPVAIHLRRVTGRAVEH
jgi:hypothetical protein